MMDGDCLMRSTGSSEYMASRELEGGRGYHGAAAGTVGTVGGVTTQHYLLSVSGCRAYSN